MDAVFAALWIDLVVAAGLGAVGGFGLGLLQERGLEMPHRYSETGISFVDLGFVADMLIGALAAVITHALNTPSNLLQLLAAAIVAGIGGGAILKGYVKGVAAREQANRAEVYRVAATDALNGMDVTERLQKLQKDDEIKMRRWGPR